VGSPVRPKTRATSARVQPKTNIRAKMWSFLIFALLLLPILHYVLKNPSIPAIPNATPDFPVVGNAISFNDDPVKFLLEQRARHGDIFLVNLSIIRIVFFLGPEGVNTILKGTEKSGISFWAMLSFLIGGAAKKGQHHPVFRSVKANIKDLQ
jgi:hypothetical protein